MNTSPTTLTPEERYHMFYTNERSETKTRKRKVNIHTVARFLRKKRTRIRIAALCGIISNLAIIIGVIVSMVGIIQLFMYKTMDVFIDNAMESVLLVIAGGVFDVMARILYHSKKNQHKR